MEWFTISHAVNLVAIVIAFSIKSELRHIRESIDNAKDVAAEARHAASRAHERLDHLMERRNTTNRVA